MSEQNYKALVAEVEKYGKAKKSKELLMIDGLGQNIFDMLPFIRRGWRWTSEAFGSLAGTFGGGEDKELFVSKGSRYTFPLKKKLDFAWIMNVSMYVNNPFASIIFTMDNVEYVTSPYIQNSIISDRPVVTNGPVFRNDVYDPSSAYGPMFGLTMDSAYPIPITKNVRYEIGVLGQAPYSTPIEVLYCHVQRVEIDDYEVFLEEYQRTRAELLSGREMKSWGFTK
jgi:hypothetical protein